MIVLNALTVGSLSNKSATILVQTETTHTCDTCGKRMKLGAAYFSWDVYGAYFTHRELCKVRRLFDRKPTVAVPATPDEPLTILPIANKRKRGAPKNEWEAKRLGWNGESI